MKALNILIAQIHLAGVAAVLEAAGAPPGSPPFLALVAPISQLLAVWLLIADGWNFLENHISCATSHFAWQCQKLCITSIYRQLLSGTRTQTRTLCLK